MTLEDMKKFNIPWFVQHIAPDFIAGDFTHYDHYIKTVVEAGDAVEYQKYLDLVPVYEAYLLSEEN